MNVSLKQMVMAVVLLMAVVAGSVFAAGKTGITIKNFTGIVQIITPEKKVITVTQGDKLPQIPLGSEIRAISGKVEIVAGDAHITLLDQQSVQISRNQTSETLVIAAAPGSKGAVNMKVGSATVTLVKGDAVAVDNSKGKPEVKVVQGDAKIVVAENKKSETTASKEQAKPENKQEIKTEDSVVTPEPPQQKLEEASPSAPAL